MNCSKCGAEIISGALFCPDCGEAVASAASPKKGGKTPAEIIGGPLGVAVALILCLWAALSAFSFLFAAEGAIMVAGAVALDLVPVVFGIIAAVAMWRVVASKDIGRDKLSHVSRFYGVLRIFATIAFVAGAIACGGIYIGVILFGALFDVGSTDLGDVADALGGSIGEMLDWLDYEIGSSVFGMFLFGSLITAAVIFYLYYTMKMHRDIKDYYDRIIAVGEGRGYNAALKAPRISLFVIAGVNFVYAIISLLFGGGVFEFFAALLMQVLLVVTAFKFALTEKAILSGNLPMAAPVQEPEAEAEVNPIEKAPEAALAPEAETVKAETASAKPAMSREQMMLMMQIMMQMQAQKKAAQSATSAPAAAPTPEPTVAEVEPAPAPEAAAEAATEPSVADVEAATEPAPEPMSEVKGVEEAPAEASTEA